MPELQEVKVSVPGAYDMESQHRGQNGSVASPALLSFMSGQRWKEMSSKGGLSLSHPPFLPFSLPHSLFFSPHLQKLHIHYICLNHQVPRHLHVWRAYVAPMLYTHVCILHSLSKRIYTIHGVLNTHAHTHTHALTYKFIPLSSSQTAMLVEHWKKNKKNTIWSRKKGKAKPPF